MRSLREADVSDQAPRASTITRLTGQKARCVISQSNGPDVVPGSQWLMTTSSGWGLRIWSTAAPAIPSGDVGYDGCLSYSEYDDCPPYTMLRPETSASATKGSGTSIHQIRSVCTILLVRTWGSVSQTTLPFVEAL